MGDYEGLDSTGRRFVPVFVTANNGDTANPTDVFSTLVRPTFGGSPLVTARAARSSAAKRALASPLRRPIQGAVRRR